MNIFKSLELLVIEGYFNSSEVKKELCGKCDYYDDENDLLFFRTRYNPEHPGDPIKIKWVDYFQEYLNDLTTKFHESTIRRDDLCKEILLNEENRLRSLLALVDSSESEAKVYLNEVNDLIQKIKQYRQRVYGIEKNEEELKPKIQTQLNVQQLGYLFRLLKELAFNNELELTEYFEIISSSFGTPKTMNISVQSLIDKSRNPEQKDIEIVHSKLIRMMQKAAMDKEF